MIRDFRPQIIDAELVDDLNQLVRLAIREDLGRSVDLTTLAMVPDPHPARAAIVARKTGIAAGIDLIDLIIQEMDAPIEVELMVGDSQELSPRQTLAILSGDSRSLLTCERTILNFLSRLCGIASWTNLFCQRIEGTKARLYDTRKTTPGWRRLEKYAVRCGGGHTHRMGLHDAILIKDNHLACRANSSGKLLNAGAAVELARAFVHSGAVRFSEPPIIEVEIDRISQLDDALDARPDIILLDNMTHDQLREAVLVRNVHAPSVELEASGGITFDTIEAVAKTGVDRISVGSLTHSAVYFDLGLDWILK
ncbi:MAG: carboxylating nicotinate-nucleotide diphosphorylase [Pirellulaceae bacterium]|nr:carboxylating nicotinate-nucleotide diphosphorylase [Pirellulaceae bacterium]